MAVKRRTAGRSANIEQFGRAAALAPLFAVLDEQYRSRTGLARKYGAARQSVNDWETGECQPPHGFIVWMSKELGLDEDFIPPHVRELVERQAKGE
jgi:transcriptional regulator with XRE-family HTH domain